MTLAKVDIDTLKRLQPVGSLSEERLRELADLCYIDRVSTNLDPFRMRSIAGQTVYLVRGEMALSYPGGASTVLIGASEEARHPLGGGGHMFASANAITAVALGR